MDLSRIKNLTSLTDFYDEVTGSVDKGRAVVVIYLIFGNRFESLLQESFYPRLDIPV